jgi:hypothetical protein
LEEEQRMMDWHEKLQPPRPEVDEKLIWWTWRDYK